MRWIREILFGLQAGVGWVLVTQVGPLQRDRPSIRLTIDLLGVACVIPFVRLVWSRLTKRSGQRR